LRYDCHMNMQPVDLGSNKNMPIFFNDNTHCGSLCVSRRGAGGLSEDGC